ncbi:hypothetical protein L861_16040 [Litchfieldella anticariensis FP35 = DSM 16096]|uniref:Uncharacterized protein n=1 Tax=Litchfieldella anticariensis (strain DSM 16096 / CECT 5854 / CIP 108499 / LMG 22089 / FP35) TaxID=1121939 RepID=S2L394_LITA3|nr:hypothetical protein L861_16040 [Halomonas anticariensis FP35 = DSM 16096]
MHSEMLEQREDGTLNYLMQIIITIICVKNRFCWLGGKTDIENENFL